MSPLAREFRSLLESAIAFWYIEVIRPVRTLIPVVKTNWKYYRTVSKRDHLTVKVLTW